MKIIVSITYLNYMYKKQSIFLIIIKNKDNRDSTSELPPREKITNI